MKMAESDRNLSQVFKTYRRHFGPLLVLSVPFFMITLVSLVLSLVFPFSLIVALPFMIIPFGFAYLILVNQILSGHTVAFASYYQIVLLGLSRFVRKTFHPFLTLMKMILLGIIATFIITLIANYMAPTSFPSLATAFDELIALAATSFTMAELNALMDVHQAALQPFFSIVGLLSSGVMLIYVVISLTLKWPTILLFTKMPQALPRIDAIHRSIYHKFRQAYIKLNFKLQWPLLVSVTSGYIAFGTIGVLLNLDVILTTLLALLGAMIVSLLILPASFVASNYIFHHFEADYIGEVKDEIKSFIQEIDAMRDLSDAQKDEIKRALNQHEPQEAENHDEQDR